MAIIDIPTGNISEVIVDKLPSKGEEFTVYRIPKVEFDDIQTTDDYTYYDGEWHPFDFNSTMYGTFFARYQESVQETVSEMQNIIDEQAQKIVELEEAVFPKAWVSFEMSITSLIMTHLDLYDEEDNLVEEGAFTTDIYESEPMTFQTEIRKGTYYLKNADGYALGLPNGDIKPLVYDDSTTVELGKVEVIMLSPKKGGKK